MWIEYLKKGKVLEAEIFRVFITHLGLHNGKISSKSVRSIEQVVRHFCRPYRALTPRDIQIDHGIFPKIDSTIILG